MNWKRVLGACIVFSPLFFFGGVLVRQIGVILLLQSIAAILAICLAVLIWFIGLTALVYG